MNLHLFFEGMQAREEVASAFFASLLEQQPEVRNELFDILADSDGVGENPAEPFKVRSWRVRVEVDGVDVRLDTKDEGAAWVILIENKLQSGSMQVGQLRRYYASQIERDKEAHVVAVYLAPGNMGESEVLLLKPSLRPGDFAVRVSWDTVTKRLQSLKPAEAGSAEFIRSGIESINKVIEAAEKEKYPNVGEREKIHEVVCKTREGLQQKFPNMRIDSPWRGKNSFTLVLSGTDITGWFEIAFEVEPNPPYRPLHLLEGYQMCLEVNSMLKLSGAARRKKESNSRWQELLSRRVVDIPGVGTHELKESGWVVKKTKVVAPVDRMPSKLTDIGALLLQWTTAFQDEQVKL